MINDPYVTLAIHGQVREAMDRFIKSEIRASKVLRHALGTCRRYVTRRLLNEVKVHSI